MIQLEGLHKTFRTASGIVEAVKDVSLTVDQGDIYGIIGFSGAGKSTLIRCVNLLERPTAGTVSIDGVELTGLNEKELRNVRKKIGMIFQHFNLMASRTVGENVAYPLKGSGLSKDEISNKVLSLLELVGLSDKKDAYPSQLSGGQKQRVAIARALANDPKVLLCDEATSALDPQTTASILKLLAEVNKKLGLTIMLITHEMGVIKEICNKVAIMEKGVVLEQGEVFSVFSEPQHTVTKNFIDSTTSVSHIYELIDSKASVVSLKDGQMLLRLKYPRQTVSNPMVSAVSRLYNVDLNIIFGDLEIVGNTSLGGLIVIIDGKPSDIQSAIAYMRENNVGVEVISNGTAH